MVKHRILCEVSEIIFFKVVNFSANGQQLDLIYKYIIALIWSSGRYACWKVTLYF